MGELDVGAQHDAVPGLVQTVSQFHVFHRPVAFVESAHPQENVPADCAVSAAECCSFPSRDLVRVVMQKIFILGGKALRRRVALVGTKGGGYTGVVGKHIQDLAQGAGLDQHVGIEEKEQFRTCHCCRAVARRRCTAIRLQAHKVGTALLGDGFAAVGGLVIDHDEFEIPHLRRFQRIQASAQGAFCVVHGNNDRNAGRGGLLCPLLAQRRRLGAVGVRADGGVGGHQVLCYQVPVIATGNRLPRGMHQATPVFPVRQQIQDLPGKQLGIIGDEHVFAILQCQAFASEAG